jgi:lysine-N-methylase
LARRLACLLRDTLARSGEFSDTNERFIAIFAEFLRPCSPGYWPPACTSTSGGEEFVEAKVSHATYYATYSESFRCIGAACEDTCCQGWTIPVDRAACDKFRILPPGALRSLIDANIVLTPQREGGAKPATFATFRMTPSNACALLSADKLCRIQTECGEAFLPHACATYPRIVGAIGDIEEKALALSCPEAARLVLLNPALLLKKTYPAITEPRYHQVRHDDPAENARSLQPWFWSIREFSLGLVANRTLPLWQRLFLLGLFCRGLESLAKGELKFAVPAFLRDFKAAVASATLPADLNALPADPGQQLDVVLRMAGMLLNSSGTSPRFVECVNAFTAGIGNAPGATFESLTTSYALAHDRYYEPFFERYPHILENYLINTIIRCQFPFGREAMRSGACASSMIREHALLTAQFSLIKGFLIGVAGFHGAAFSTAHVVHTVQSVSKHFEHHVEFLDQAHALLVESQVDNDRGVAVMLRNDRPANKPAPRGNVSGPRNSSGGCIAIKS